MRLWSLHPRYLDPQGLVALWRGLRSPECHPLMRVCAGPIEAWERNSSRPRVAGPRAAR